MNEKELALKIQNDLDSGVFDLWPDLKSRLQQISNRLAQNYYIGNSHLSGYDWKLLVENDYVKL